MTKNACCHSAQPTGRNHQCYNGNREEGRKEERKEGRKNEEGVCQPGFEPVMYDFTRMWITTEPITSKVRQYAYVNPAG